MNGVQFPLRILNYNYPVLDHWILSPIFILSLCIPKQILPFGPSPLWIPIYLMYEHVILLGLSISYLEIGFHYPFPLIGFAQEWGFMGLIPTLLPYTP